MKIGNDDFEKGKTPTTKRMALVVVAMFKPPDEEAKLKDKWNALRIDFHKVGEKRIQSFYYPLTRGPWLRQFRELLQAMRHLQGRGEEEDVDLSVLKDRTTLWERHVLDSSGRGWYWTPVSLTYEEKAGVSEDKDAGEDAKSGGPLAGFDKEERLFLKTVHGKHVTKEQLYRAGKIVGLSKAGVDVVMRRADWKGYLYVGMDQFLIKIPGDSDK